MSATPFFSRALSRHRKWTLGIFLSYLLINPAAANKVGIWPLDPVIGKGQSATRLNLRNLDAAAPTRIQASVMLWQQVDGQDQLTPQRAIVVSPPQVEIKPGAEQLFRVLVRSPLPTLPHQGSYRVLFEEVPASHAPQDSSQVRISMRYSLPLIIEFEATPTPLAAKQAAIAQQAHFTLAATPTPRVNIINQSPWVLRMSKVAISDAEGVRVSELAAGLWGYALPHSQRTIELTPAQYASLAQRGRTLVYHHDDQEFRLAPKP